MTSYTRARAEALGLDGISGLMARAERVVLLGAALLFAPLGALPYGIELLAALSAVIVPEIVMSSGQLLHTWQDARLYAAAAGVAWYFWRKRAGHAVLGTIVVGMGVYLPLHLGLGW